MNLSSYIKDKRVYFLNVFISINAIQSISPSFLASIGLSSPFFSLSYAYSTGFVGLFVLFLLLFYVEGGIPDLFRLVTLFTIAVTLVVLPYCSYEPHSANLLENPDFTQVYIDWTNPAAGFNMSIENVNGETVLNVFTSTHYNGYTLHSSQIYSKPIDVEGYKNVYISTYVETYNSIATSVVIWAYNQSAGEAFHILGFAPFSAKVSNHMIHYSTEIQPGNVTYIILVLQAGQAVNSSMNSYTLFADLSVYGVNSP